jgi:hypothetical protein
LAYDDEDEDSWYGEDDDEYSWVSDDEDSGYCEDEVPDSLQRHTKQCKTRSMSCVIQKRRRIMSQKIVVKV